METKFYKILKQNRITETGALALVSAAAVLRKDAKVRDIIAYIKGTGLSAEKTYEALLQTYLFAGFPTALIALEIYSEYFDIEEGYNLPSLEELKREGEKTCRNIYGDKYEKLIENINTFSPELAQWLVLEGYGKVLSRENLSLQERETCIVAMLTALKFDNQLYSHINGAFRINVSLGDLEKVINSLDLLGVKGIAEYGLGELEKFKESKFKNNRK